LENFDLMKFQELECRIEVLVEENNFSWTDMFSSSRTLILDSSSWTVFIPASFDSNFSNKHLFPSSKQKETAILLFKS
jgi:hypothetical protein